MNAINKDEHKKILLNLLREFINICDKNNIKYSLIGGSLIGVIRHGGMIPWDDDIDIILMEEEFEKLENVIVNYKNDRYKFVNHETSEDNYYPFYKFIDTYTILEEEKIKNIKDNGVFLDIFKYINVPKNKLKSKVFFSKIKLIRKLLILSITKKETRVVEKKLLNKLLYKISDMIGSNNIVKIYMNLKNKSKKYNKSKYIMCEWPTYKLEKEIMNKEDYESYIVKRFDGIDVTIFNNYDKILTTTFGNYMELPPLNKRNNTHNLKVYYR